MSHICDARIACFKIKENAIKSSQTLLRLLMSSNNLFNPRYRGVGVCVCVCTQLFSDCWEGGRRRGRWRRGEGSVLCLDRTHCGAISMQYCVNTAPLDLLIVVSEW